MGTKALPHAGIGVPSYAWSTSPLRRYTDLVNQWQIIACAQHGATAALAAPFKPKDAELFSIISGFDAAYSAYNSVQSSMERYWTLRHVQQQNIDELEASLVKEMGGGSWLVRADTLPLMFSVLGAQGLMRGARVRVKLGDVDLMALDVHGTVTAHLDAPSDADAVAADAENQEADDDEVMAAGPLTIAVDLSDSTQSDGS
jgi:exoribonuclease-2